MPKKIYDIKPPKVAKKAEKKIKEFLDEDPKIVINKKPHVVAEIAESQGGAQART